MSLYDEVIQKTSILEIFLSKFIKEHLSKIKMDQIDPFENDNEFFIMYECYFAMEFKIWKFSEECEKLSAINEVKNYTTIVDGLRFGKKIIKEVIQKRIETTKKDEKLFLPRILRVSEKYQLSPKEKEFFIYLVICHSGSYLPTIDIDNISSFKSLGNYCEATPKEILNFTSSHRLHIKQGILEIDANYKDLVSSNVIKVPLPVLCSLLGSEIIPEEFLKIDKTVLSEVLLEEPGFHIEGITGTEKIKKEEENNKNEENLEDEKLLKEFEEITQDGKKSFDVFSFIKDDQKKNQVIIKKKDDEKDDLILTPYTTDVEYLEDRFLLLATKMRMRNIEMEQKDEDSYKRTDRNPETILRELRAKERMLTGKCEKRMKMTLETKWEPRLEKLGRIRNLSEFEKTILVALVGGIISNEITLVRKYSSDFTVGSLLSILCDSLQERIHNRKVFYRNSTLVSDGFIRVSDKLSEDLMNCQVDIDRRMLDYFVGLDCEFGEIVEGSNLYYPKVKLENVIIPENTKKLILSTVSNYEEFKKYRKKFGFEDIVSYGRGIVLLFYGESGTGKTYLANAIANQLQKKILLINFGSLGDKVGDILKFIFREAKINDALLFFDECESFFESRDKFVSNIQPFLTEIERHDGLIILATNRPYDLDEAMHRRITLAIEFQTPDPFLRESIWRKHLPEQLHSDDIDFEKLALNYELTGGLIKNAVLTALSLSVSRDTQNPKIKQDDLEKGAKLQLRGEFSQKSFEKKVTPQRSLDELILDDKVKDIIYNIVSFEKSRRILYSQWGFNEKMSQRHGTSILVYGPTGCGKSSVLEGIGFELGLPLKVVDMVEVLTKYSFSTSQNIQNIFKETKKLGAILVFEIQQSGFFRIEESIQLLLSNIEHYEGIVVLNITVDNNFTMVDRSIFMKFKFNIEFTKPNQKLRLQMWKKMIPTKAPFKNMDFEKLSNYELTGGEIYDIIFKTASKCSLRKEKIIEMKDVIQSIEETLKSKTIIGIENMFY